MFTIISSEKLVPSESEGLSSQYALPVGKCMDKGLKILSSDGFGTTAVPNVS